MLFVVCAQTAIVRTAPLHGRVIDSWHLWRLKEYLTAAPVVVHIVRYQDALGSVFRAALE
jgi:hypothetical protein